uniref:DUF223 domain-containing protein n=1 Tax=Brassica oleracea TaxID=3712 RepID=A0A3P6DWW2_BRAOL|nr:unnamed protein product [Brassica oleracea]
MLINFSVTHSCLKYKDVLDGTLNPDTWLVNIIGQIVEISHIDHINVNGKETEKISLEFFNPFFSDERLPNGALG